MVRQLRRRSSWLAGLAAIGLLAGACGGDGGGSGTKPGQVTKVKIGSGAFSITPSAVLLAKEMGYFLEEGIDAELFETGGGANSMSAVVSGSADFAAVVIKDTIDAARKQDVYAVTVALLMARETGGLVIRKKFAEDRGITEDMSLADKVKRMKGARLATQGLGSAQEARWRLMFREYGDGLDASKDAKLLVIQGGTSAQVAALRSNQVDALTTAPPVPEQLVADGQAIWLANLMLGDVERLRDVPFFGLATNEKNVKERPQVVEAVTRAVGRAQKLIQEDPTTASDRLYKAYFSDVDAAVWKEVFAGMQQAAAKNPVLSEHAVKRLYEESYGEQPDRFAERLFDRTITEKVTASL